MTEDEAPCGRHEASPVENSGVATAPGAEPRWLQRTDVLVVIGIGCVAATVVLSLALLDLGAFGCLDASPHPTAFCTQSTATKIARWALGVVPAVAVLVATAAGVRRHRVGPIVAGTALVAGVTVAAGLAFVS